MSDLTVTAALRKVIANNKFDNHKGYYRTTVFSDTRKPVPGVKAVGAKFCGLVLDDKQKAKVKSDMEALGFTHHYINYNDNPYTPHMFRHGVFNGTRFCFSK